MERLKSWEVTPKKYQYLPIIIGFSFIGSFSFVLPLARCAPQSPSKCHYIVNYCVSLQHVGLGVAKMLHPQNWRGTNGKEPL